MQRIFRVAQFVTAFASEKFAFFARSTAVRVPRIAIGFLLFDEFVLNIAQRQRFRFAWFELLQRRVLLRRRIFFFRGILGDQTGKTVIAIGLMLNHHLVVAKELQRRFE